MRQTGRDWADWCALLDAEGAAALPHPEIVAIVRDKYAGGSWWSQMIVVGYERLRGLRAVGQSRSGSYATSASRTLPIAAEAAHALFTDEAARDGWLGVAAPVRSAAFPKSVRLAWPDGTIAAVFITAKGAGKCGVGVEHGKLPDPETAAALKSFWQTALDRLLAAAQPDARTIEPQRANHAEAAFANFNDIVA
jgi:hypothetical protein